ncbi:MAG TPA: LamG-like jellyroll fold domain-containing protein, partial [Verrucomicrobiae bacterium]|nr:LamG-like jellyroll fold domain-containing protein [Verrucomicrobiae bacterium]
MKSLTKLVVTGMMTTMGVFCCSIANAQLDYTSVLVPGGTLIYSNAFNGTAGVNITNTLPNYAVSIDGGTNGAEWIDALGANDTNAFYANGVMGTAQGNGWLLPCGPQSNFVYVLEATVTFTGYPSSWIGAGFASYDKIIGGTDDRPNSGGVDFGIMTASSENVQAFDVNTSHQMSSTNGVFSPALGAPHTLQMVLDTTTAENPSNKWTIACYIDGHRCLGTAFNGILTYSANPTILGVGIWQNALGNGNGSDFIWDSLLLYAYQLALVEQPKPMSVNQGTGASFTVLAAGTPPFSYQWYTNGVALVNDGDISGVTNATLSISSAIPGYSSTNFYCVVTNAYGAITSAPASLGVYTTPQFLTADPVTYTNLMTLFGGTNIEGTNYLGSTPTFSVYAAGLGPMAYFWLTNGDAVGGANTSTFTYTNCQLDSPTNFTCIASNSLGTATNVWLAQYVPTPTAPYPQAILADNPSAYWRLDETNDDPNQYNDGEICDDFMSGNNGIYTNTALAQLGSGYWVVANGVDITNDPTETSAQFGPYDATTGCDANSMGTNVDFSAFTNAEFSVSTWANGGFGYSGTEPVNGGIVVKGYYGTEEYGLDCGGSGGTARFFIRTAGNSVVSASSTFQLGGKNTWHHLVGVCDESNGVINLYIDGLLTAQTAVSKGAGVLPEATAPITIGASTTSGTFTGDHQFDGALDDVAIFNHALSAAQVLELFQAPGGEISLNLTAPLPPTNTVWRQNSTLTIPAFAVGAPPIGYYWTNVTTGGILGGANIKGGSGVSVVSTLTATLTITNAPPSYSGDQLELVVTNSSGSTNWFTTLFSYPPPITIGYTNSILYSNVFDGGAWNLAGTATTEANSLVGGTNSTWTDAMGTNDTGSMEGSGLDNSTLGDSWVLPFKPEPGFVYTITASAYMTGFPGSWIGAGFAGPVTSNNSGSARFADPDMYGYDFIIWVINTGNVEYLQGPGAALYITNVNNFISTSTPITHTAQVVLDTTGPQWIQYAFMDGTPAGTNAFASIPPIGSVGLTQSGLGAPNDVQWTSFLLTAVSPNGFPPYLLNPVPSTNSILLTNGTITVNATGFGTGPWGYSWINNSTVLASGATNNTAPDIANLSIGSGSLSAGQLELVLTNAVGTNITIIPLVSQTSFVPITWGVTNGNLYLSWPSANIGAQ